MEKLQRPENWAHWRREEGRQPFILVVLILKPVKKSFIHGKIIENLWEEENALCKESKKKTWNELSIEYNTIKD